MLDTSKVYTSNGYGNFIVIKVNSWDDILIEFIDTKYRMTTRKESLTRGNVKDRLIRSVFGVGFIGDGEYKPRVKKVKSKVYVLWTGMLQRCYYEKSRDKNTTYKGCTVCDEWHNFQNFAKWFDENYIDGFDLDKDIKVDGNKVYSPEACIFVSRQDNIEKAHAKKYCFLNVKGDIFNVYNLLKFCRENNLNSKRMYDVSAGRRKTHKGWSLSDSGNIHLIRYNKWTL